MLEDIFRGIGFAIGTVFGPIIGISVEVIATTLGITIAMVEEAINSGCDTYEEIRNYHNL